MATLRSLLVVLEEDSPKGVVNEAHISAESCTSSTWAWLPCSKQDAGRAEHLEAPPCQGPAAARREQIVEVVVGIATGGFKREDRLLRAAEFRYLARYGRRAQVRGFLVMAAVCEGEAQQRRGRLGITVSRHVGNAVLRNQLKRRIREWFRHKRPVLRVDLDMVVVARREAAGISHDELTKALEAGVRAVGLLA